ncbi:putative Chorismate mutase 3 [Hibiscus syriacus]|uniref:Chorismate mutase 3 n=1 Tax=Hibiscus syriacus TaxID=106335 RepID=A0A6A2XC85_HIBSY|nr:putative Chorismate mutase 3 [Hibiscus syriacus]
MKKINGSSKAAVATVIVCLLLVWFHTMSLSMSSISRINDIIAATSSSSWSSSTYTLKKNQDTRVEITTVASQQNRQLLPLVGVPMSSPISCNRSYIRYDLCTIDGSTVLDPAASTFFTIDPTSSVRVETIKPYPRKYEGYIMGQIKELSLVSGPSSPKCTIRHEAPAIVFSAGGYTGNLFHAFNDGFIPLFITINSIYADRDFIIVVSEYHDWWHSKYAELLKVLSKHEIISLEKENVTHCFPSATLGIISHGFMTIDPTLIPTSKTLLHFRDLLEKAYSQNPIPYPPLDPKPERRPRLVLTCRGNDVSSRRILNQDEVVRVMKEVGFDVTVFEPNRYTSLDEAYTLFNSSHMMIGVHGAALTHSLFLRPGVEESSLIEKYGKDNVLLKDPLALQKKGWPTEIMDIYLKQQNVKLDLVRFRISLESAYLMAKKFMLKERGGNGAGTVLYYPFRPKHLRLMWTACALKGAFWIGVLCAILTPVAKVMAKRLKHTQNGPNEEHITINSRLCANLPTHGISAKSSSSTRPALDDDVERGQSSISQQNGASSSSRPPLLVGMTTLDTEIGRSQEQEPAEH